MSLINLLATLGLLLSRPAAADPSVQKVPVVQVPFGCGLAFEVSQSHNVGSHLDNDTWAWDFRMPEGVPIVASKDGVVRMSRGDSTVGGCDAKYAKFANYVVIDHGDGTEAQYLHFSSVVVEAGQKVNAGELLGYSGKTGWACGSHLHFKIAKRTHNGWNNPSIPAAFAGHGDPEAFTLVNAPACPNPRPQTIHADATKRDPEMRATPATGSSAGVTTVAKAVTGPQHAAGADETSAAEVGGNAAK